MSDNRERQQAVDKTSESEDERVARIQREAQQRRPGTRKQVTPPGTVDDTIEGEGTPGLDVTGGGGHA